MLLELRIVRIGLVDELAMPLAPGLTMLTGETGAGKSMVAGALSLLCGGQASKDLVREGEELGWVEAVFDLGEAPRPAEICRRAGVRLADDGILVLRRELRRVGRGRVLINGLVSSLALLERIGPELLNVQSQHQQLELAQRGFARDYLDGALGLDGERAAMDASWRRWREAEQALAARTEEVRAAADQLDLWAFQRDELQAAGLDPDEERTLGERLDVLQNFEAVRDAVARSLQILGGGEGDARELLGKASGALAGAGAGTRDLDEAREALAQAEEAAATAAVTLDRFLDGLSHDPAALDELQARKAMYEELRRKYGRGLDEIIALRDDLQRRLERHDDARGDLEALTAERDEAAAAAAGAALALRTARREGAPRVAEGAARTIRPLSLPDFALDFLLEPILDPDAHLAVEGEACRVDAAGADRIAIAVRTNPGERARPVLDVASGGERSRIHLGLSVHGRSEDDPPFLVLDEIDAGLGMDAARPVARLLRELAKTGQVLCITHLPTMAVHGDDHWRVRKTVEAERTVLAVDRLGGEARLRELERLLGGVDESDDEAGRRRYAKELLAEAGVDVSSGLRG